MATACTSTPPSCIRCVRKPAAPSLLGAPLVRLFQNIWVMGAPQLSLIFDPVPFNALTAEQRNWTGLGACGSSPSTSPCGDGYGYGWDTPDDVTPTSKVVCLWFGGSWGPVWPQSFDNVIVSFATLLEMATVRRLAPRRVSLTSCDALPVPRLKTGQTSCTPAVSAWCGGWGALCCP